MIEAEGPVREVDMPKVEIRAELLRQIAQDIGRLAEAFPVGSMERRDIELLMRNDTVMVEAFIQMHLGRVKAEDG
ncbi:hypothetical protein C0V75_07570 [Tabrizicola sp. TH137]|uniref:hypothetical protein n=1 Tax=Tabrizicola sp. TH137 TaxID=2067452 RepID=UPI000C7CECC2|nr:hypothetical protein [Tabrizicola sp. TH137]PLL13257.1 hypothetical protein C0V75_07570 [Tabrizicola sp. TH137]